MHTILLCMFVLSLKFFNFFSIAHIDKIFALAYELRACPPRFVLLGGILIESNKIRTALRRIF